MWRLYLVLTRCKGLKRTVDLEVHLRRLKEVEPLRHRLQHLDEHLRKIARDDRPVLGSLSWFWSTDPPPPRGGRIFILAAGAVFRHAGALPFQTPGASVSLPISDIALTAVGKRIDISNLYQRVVSIARGLDAGARQAFAGAAPAPGGDLIATLELSFTRPAGKARE